MATTKLPDLDVKELEGSGWEYHGTDAEKSPSIDVVVAKPFDAAKLQHMLAEVQQLRVGIA